MNNPLMYNDPSGEFFFFPFLVAWGMSTLWAGITTAAIIGAAVGLASYSIGVAITGQRWSLGGALKSILFGAVSGAVTFGIGELFASSASTVITLGDKIAKAMCEGFMHGFSQGLLSVFQGGNFVQGFASGALGSLGASGWSSAFGKSGGSMIAFGALAGGVGAELTGGNFWQGAITGGIVAGLNHAAHSYLKNRIYTKLEGQLKDLGYNISDVPKMSVSKVYELVEHIPLLKKLFGNSYSVYDERKGNFSEGDGHRISLNSEIDNSRMGSYLSFGRFKTTLLKPAFDNYGKLVNTLAEAHFTSKSYGIEGYSPNKAQENGIKMKSSWDTEANSRFYKYYDPFQNIDIYPIKPPFLKSKW
ncbi:MAG: hypothetical protein KBA33_08855 [Cloacibacterium sp.]|nr:hypothetical protein [Cloacibacterium sp.]